MLPLLFLLCLLPVGQSASNRILVKVHSSGEQGFNQKLRNSLESSFKSSPDFRLSYKGKPKTLIVSIKPLTRWTSEGMDIPYNVEFSSIGNVMLLGISTGSCLNNDGTIPTLRVNAASEASRILHYISTALRTDWAWSTFATTKHTCLLTRNFLRTRSTNALPPCVFSS